MKEKRKLDTSYKKDLIKDLFKENENGEIIITKVELEILQYAWKNAVNFETLCAMVKNGKLEINYKE